MAVYAAGALGKQKTNDSKKAIKDLITDTKLGAEVRKAAMSALAVHWKDSDVFPLPKFVPEMELKSVEESPSPNQRRESRKGVRDVGPGVRRIAERTEGGEALRW
jgi:hypothetical protein